MRTGNMQFVYFAIISRFHLALISGNLPKYHDLPQTLGNLLSSMSSL